MRKVQGLILAVGIICGIVFSSSASAQCGKPGGATQLKSNEYFTVLKNGKIQLREGFQMEKVTTAEGHQFVRIFSTKKLLADAGLTCGCSGASTESNCTTIVSGGGGSADCLGECRNGSARSFCGFSFVQAE